MSKSKPKILFNTKASRAYATASDAEKMILDKLLEPIDYNPDRREAVCVFGNKDTPRKQWLAAAPEVMRRYDKEYLPEARQGVKETPNDPDAKQYLADVRARQRELRVRIAAL